jgi:hypothetical protein
MCRDEVVLVLNRQALTRLLGEKRLVVVPNATRQPSEQMTYMDQVVHVAYLSN